MRTKLFQIRTKPLIFTDKWPNIHYKLLKKMNSNKHDYEKLKFNYCIPKNKFIKTLTTVFQSGISLESVPHAHLTIEYPSPLCC